MPRISHAECFTAADILALARVIVEMVTRCERLEHDLADVRAFALPADAAEAHLGDTVSCPTCGAEWENITSRDPTWVACGYEG